MKFAKWVVTACLLLTVFLSLSGQVFGDESPGQPGRGWHHPETVEAVENLMVELDTALSAEDGTVWFNLLYLKTTRNVLKASQEGVFEDEEFLRRFIVVFANMYFKALNGRERGEDNVSKAWTALFKHSRNRKYAPIQFAMAGLIAHISRDIPQALVETSLEMGISLGFATPQHRDFLRINNILKQTLIEIKQEVGGICGDGERSLLCQLDDDLSIAILARFRDKAFADGNMLWSLKDRKGAYQAYLQWLEESTSLAGESVFSVKL